MTHGRSTVVEGSIQVAPQEYSPVEEQMFRSQIERALTIIGQDIDRLDSLKMRHQSVAMRRLQFIAMARGEQ